MQLWSLVVSSVQNKNDDQDNKMNSSKSKNDHSKTKKQKQKNSKKIKKFMHFKKNSSVLSHSLLGFCLKVSVSLSSADSHTAGCTASCTTGK